MPGNRQQASSATPPVKPEGYYDNFYILDLLKKLHHDVKLRLKNPRSSAKELVEDLSRQHRRREPMQDTAWAQHTAHTVLSWQERLLQ